MSRYVDIAPIIADIHEKWGGDPAYYIGVSGADAHEAKLNADIIEFLRSKPSIDIVRCKDCKFNENVDGTTGCSFHNFWSVGNDGFCNYGERRKDDE